MIGVFDSGLGGAFLLKSLIQYFPNQSFIYLADRANFPYGDKKAHIVQDLVRKNINFLFSKGAKKVLVACNTATTVLEKNYPIPVMGVIDASLKKAHQDSINKRVGLLATSRTVNSDFFLNRAKELGLSMVIYQQACPFFSPFIEGELKGYCKDSLIKKYVDPLLDKGVDSIILGCTHYLILKSDIKKYIGKNKKVVDPLQFIKEDLIKEEEHTFSLKKTYQDITFFANTKNKTFEEKLKDLWGKSDLVLNLL